MTTWFTADLHLGHRNIISYCNRPWPDVDAMDAGLVARWNDTVAPDDVVWVLGDVALDKIERSLALVGTLHGRKLLVAGNHDRCWAPHGRRTRGWTERYLDAGFAEVHQGTVPLRLGEVDVLACHFPYRGDSQAEDRYVEHRPHDDGGWLLHGHVHDTWGQRGRMINVGVDACGYRPIAEAELRDVVAAGPADRATLAASA